MINDNLKYLFGPVPSRRLGRSLGVNVAPSKVCSMDCIYCEVGVTTLLTDKLSNYFKAEDILNEFGKNYDSFKDSIDVVTITAAGEPTLNSELGIILSGLRKVTDKKIALLTNSTMLKDREVFDTVLKFDIVVPSLDAVTETTFIKINKPCNNIKIDEVIDCLTKFSFLFKGELLLEILFVKDVNDSIYEISKMISVIKNMRYSAVDISTIYRPPAYKDFKALNSDELDIIRNRFSANGVNVRDLKKFSAVNSIKDNTDETTKKILALLKLRPVTEYEIKQLFGIDDNDIKAILTNPDIVKSDFNSVSYFHDRRLRLNR